ncbi:MAG: FGGY family carbohydrate kinase [Saprospiraceae bacterium]
MAHLLGIDLGSSSVKVSLVDSNGGRVLAKAQSPAKQELKINVKKAGWAEQNPELWWKHTEKAIALLAKKHSLAEVDAIGIGYQMHGLVLLNAEGKPVRPSIIWCDSRAVELGHDAELALGQGLIETTTLNSPGNFTASKWAWVKEHEPKVLAKAVTAMLPGDYIAFKLTGERNTTASGLSEMVLWDFGTRQPAYAVLDHYGLDISLLPPLVPTFGEQGQVKHDVCEQFGFRQNAQVTYRAGDQPNNAYSLKALNPGETAATAGTSGVVYAVTDQRKFDEQQRVNTFLHVNDSIEAERLGILLCINGTGSGYAWLRRMLGAGGVMPGYNQFNTWASESPIGSNGMLFYPFGNGAERLLGNTSPGATIKHLNFNTHGVSEMSAAVQDGIAAAMAFGGNALGELGAQPTVVRSGRANLFLSDRFCQAFCQLTGVPLELYDTDGAQGAARAAGVGSGAFSDHHEALSSLEQTGEFTPKAELGEAYADFFGRWQEGLL